MMDPMDWRRRIGQPSWLLFKTCHDVVLHSGGNLPAPPPPDHTRPRYKALPAAPPLPESESFGNGGSASAGPSPKQQQPFPDALHAHSRCKITELDL